MTKTRAFTLIELLVVIAIIGVLSAVVLANLGTARNKGSDASIKTTMRSILEQSGLDYDGNGNSYGTQAWTANASTFTVGGGPVGATAVFNDPVVGNAIKALIAQGGSVSYGASATQWVLVTPLPGAGGYWCIDWTGKPKPEATAPTTVNNYTSGTTYGCI